MDMEQIRAMRVGNRVPAGGYKESPTMRVCDTQPVDRATRMLLLSAWEAHGDGFLLNENDHDDEFPS
jgi:hypothetical protein